VGRRHLVAELLTQGDKLAIRVLQKKCIYSGKKKYSLPVHTLPAVATPLLKSYQELSALVVQLSDKQRKRREEGTLQLEPVLQTAKGALLNSTSVRTVLSAMCTYYIHNTFNAHRRWEG
jgi:hypothetical protein